MSEKKKKKWQNAGLYSAVTVVILLVFYLLRLNFGEYLSQIWNAFQSVLIPSSDCFIYCVSNSAVKQVI